MIRICDQNKEFLIFSQKRKKERKGVLYLKLNIFVKVLLSH